jgi:hypothetical protein
VVEGDRLRGADRQWMAEAKQQPARFTVVDPRHSTSVPHPSFFSPDRLEVGAELLQASVGQGPQIKRADPPLGGDEEVEKRQLWTRTCGSSATGASNDRSAA